MFAESEKPVVASYCGIFLKPEMCHIYRQVTALQRYNTFVVTQQRLGAQRFPYDDLILLPKPPQPVLRRFYLKYIKKVPSLQYRGELDQLVRLFETKPADLMHIYFGHIGVHLRQFVERWEKPCIVSFHGADVMPRLQDRGYLDRMWELFTLVPLVLARSQSLADRLVDLGCPKEKIRLNRTGIPLDDFPFVERRAPEDGAWRLVQSCRLIAKKGLRTSLRAFAEFNRLYPKSTFTIAGDGPMREELRHMASQLKISHALHFAGFLGQSDLNRLYAESHIFLHPSELTEKKDQEGIPNSMLEAMATGLPAAATLHGGIPEAVEDGETGFLVPERDDAALAEALKHLAASPELAFEMGRCASRSVREEFAPSRAIAKLEASYDEARELGKPAAERALAHV
ncbi:MAG: glycosyltransferase [Chthoniobacteraceae bacterium]